MKLLPSYSIHNSILDLINTATKRLIIVSPFINVGSYSYLKSYLCNAVKKRVDVVLIVKDTKENLIELKDFAHQTVFVPRLHAKLYINESYGILTSKNLLKSSVGSVDIAHVTTTEKERKELLCFINDNIIHLRSKRYKNKTIVCRKPGGEHNRTIL